MHSQSQRHLDGTFSVRRGALERFLRLLKASDLLMEAFEAFVVLSLNALKMLRRLSLEFVIDESRQHGAF